MTKEMGDKLNKVLKAFHREGYLSARIRSASDDSSQWTSIEVSLNHEEYDRYPGHPGALVHDKLRAMGRPMFKLLRIIQDQ